MPVAPISLETLPYAYGPPALTGILRQNPEDFFVEEILGFEPEGSGEHVFLWLEKKGLNTQQVADRLAKLAKVAAKKVSYSGMKDRQAITRQWFSVHLPGHQERDWSAINSDEISLLNVTRHLRKLRRGAHKANRFVITLSELAGDGESVVQRLQLIRQQGAPNYFGEQRFGHGGSNLHRAQQWFAGEFKPQRHQRGIYLSAARSYLFNQVLAKRVAEKSWHQLLSGELLMLNGSHSVFSQQDGSDLEQRLVSGDIHLTGPLSGKSSGLSAACEVLALEESVMAEFPELQQGLIAEGLKAERRALRLMPSDLQWTTDGTRAELSFTLASGCFATVVVRELVQYQLNAKRG